MSNFKNVLVVSKKGQCLCGQPANMAQFKSVLEWCPERNERSRDTDDLTKEKPMSGAKLFPSGSGQAHNGTYLSGRGKWEMFNRNSFQYIVIC